MKLYFAGTGSPSKDSFLYNCTRNKQCQKQFFVPIASLSSLVQFYVDLPGLPSLYSITLFGDCEEMETGVVSNTYTVGQKPDESFYGVFGDLIPADPIVSKCFYLKFVFTIGGIDYTYFSEQMCFPECDNLTLLRGCYPNEEIGSDAEDCNGIYYGFSTGATLGINNYRYFHWAWVRNGEVVEQKNKFTFTVFNSKKAYKSVFERERMFYCELVPAFYKDVLIGIYNRGNVTIGNKNYLLAESQEISIVDNDSKLWKCDVTLGEECKQFFGCAELDCILPSGECCSPTASALVTCRGPEIANIPFADQHEDTLWHHEVPILGTGPFTLSNVVKPAWMTITIVGSNVVLDGVPPDPEEDSEVSFDVENDCGTDHFETTINILGVCCSPISFVTATAEFVE